MESFNELKSRIGAMNQGQYARVLDCGGKRSATPLSHARRFTLIRIVSLRPKAPSPLGSAVAVQTPSTAYGSW